MDKNLLTLWQSVPSGGVKQEEIAELLELSPRQTSRSLKKWQEQGWFDYSSGRGRGKASNLKWLRNVEEEFECQLMKWIDKDAVEKSSKYLLYDWSEHSKERLMDKFRSKFGYIQSPDKQDKLIIPRKYPLLTIHPLETAEVQGAHIVTNVFNRLVAVDSNGIVSPELAHSWDAEPDKVRLYLKKGVKFHDGSMLTAQDVVKCLEKIRKHVHFKNLWEPVTEIYSPAPLVVDILFPGGCSYCLQMLGMMNASIYKEPNGQLVGTGSFFVEAISKSKATLQAFKDHFRERPLLDVVEFVVVPADFDFTYRSAAEEKTQETVQVESDSGFGIVIMNAFRDSDIRQKDVRDFIHHIISKHRHGIERVDERISPNHKSCLAGQDQHYLPPEIRRPNFKKPLVLKTTSYVANTTAWLQSILEKEGVPIEIMELPFEEYTFNKMKNRQADLFIHGEIFEMNQNFSFYQFLVYGYSPLASIVQSDASFSRLTSNYKHTPFERWITLNLAVERALLESSILVPLYYVKRQIPFSINLLNIKISHFGYVDFAKLWLRPQIKK
ncbi:ABC transporter substrate-binding protein [Planomicrobium sp. CPCC 101079]|uniref:ABC transporter substrate-binding protein n=1 Tax=Planomicrobium sp. CPCC 101079 TaxID=2599618 RepID=UPI0011B55F24|nr:ABC transporter substrate-binding protein [Planomicrobium sp. CPCC 101079]TWT09362.1 ABC transporter substrate-binding protein [Planomicrobium sp. CPCC 101079]